jgi:tetratricopeptide (TPR) repeat protein
MPSPHQRTNDLFLEALRQPPAERGRFVAEQCGADAPLRDRVEALLRLHEQKRGRGRRNDDTDIAAAAAPPAAVVAAPPAQTDTVAPFPLPVIPGPRLSRSVLIGGSVVAIAGLLTASASLAIRRGGRARTVQDTIILADFNNTTGEPIFNGALKVALAVALEQSPLFRVFPDDRARATLPVIDRSPDGPITAAIAREIAQRERLTSLLAGSIASAGAGYVIALEAINARTGDVTLRVQAEAGSRAEVLPVLGQTAAKLRRRIGEPSASIQKFDVPLVTAATPSLDALHAYAAALAEERVNRRLEATTFLKQAIERDPDFALALSLLASVYANGGQSELAPALAQQAFDRRDRVSQRDRFFISFRYYRDVTQDWASALELTRRWTATYPGEPFAFNSLGTALSHFAQWEEAAAAHQAALTLDPRFMAAYANLAGVFMAMNRFDRAKQILQEASALGLNSYPIRRMSYLVAFYEGDSATMARQLEASVGAGQTNAAYGWQARSGAFNGSIRTAHEQFRRGMEMASRAGFKTVVAQLAVEDAEAHAVVGQCAQAIREVRGGLLSSRDNDALERGSRVLALCGRDDEAARLVQELAERFGEATLTTRVAMPLTTAAIAVQRGEPARALELLEPVRPYDHAPKSEFWSAYLRGQAHLQLKEGRAAVEQFTSILDRRGEYPNAPLYPLARLGLARGAALAGDVAAARQAYLDFFKLWNGADPDLRPLKEAREEYARLQ